MVLSLSEIIKQEVKKKQRPLKILCDWDDVLQAHKPYSLYVIENPTVPFNQWYEAFWDKVKFEKIPGAENKRALRYSYVFEVLTDEDYKRLGVEKDKFDKARQNRDEFALRKLVARVEKDFYNKTPFLSIAESLIESMPYIRHLEIVSSGQKSKYPPGGDPRKRKKFAETFGNFPQAKLTLIPLTQNNEGNSVPYRWDWAKENFPDFDLFIDDNQGTIQKTKETFSSCVDQKVFVMPDYKNNQKIRKEGIVPTIQKPVDLKPQDFATEALKYRLNKLEQEINSSNRSTRITSLIILFGTILTPLLLLLLIIFYQYCLKEKS